MLNENELALLNKLGINDYEAKAYTTLVEHGPTTATELSPLSTVPQGRIYDVLSTLEKRGFVKVQPGRPKMYKATRPARALLKALEEYKHSLANIEDDISQLAEKLDDEYIVTDGSEVPTGFVWLIKGLRNIILKLEEVVKGAEKKIHFVAAPPFPLFEGIKDAIKARNDEGNVEIRQIAYKNEKPAFEFLKNTRKTTHIYENFILIDGKEAMLLTVRERGKKKESKVALWVLSPSLVDLTQHYFNTLWEDSEE